MENSRQNTDIFLHSYRYRFFFFFLIGFSIILSYQNGLNAPFFFDDYGNIVGNEHIAISSLSIQNIKKIFSPNQTAPNRKISNFSFAINYYLGRLNPVGFHFINILIHIINGWLTFMLFHWYLSRVPLKPQWNSVVISGIAALWWATNPIQTNAVTYIVQRMTSLSTLFCLTSLLLYLKSKSLKTNIFKPSIFNRKLILCLASVFAWILALLSKEIAAILPVLIIVHEVYFFDLYGRFKVKQKQYIIVFILIFTVLITEIIYFLGPFFWNQILKGYTFRNFNLLERILTEPRVVFHYIYLFLYPLPTKLHLFYDSYQISRTLWSPPSTALALVGTLIWLYAILFFFKKNRLLSFGLLWTFLCLLIESTVISLELVFEHRFYMSSIGFVLAMVMAIIWLLQLASNRSILFNGCMAIIIFSQVLGTSTRNRTWANEIEFSTNEVQKNPASVRALTYLGWVLLGNEKPDAAEPLFQRALHLDPNNIIALNNLFAIYNNPPRNNNIIAEFYMQKVLTAVKNHKAKLNDNQALLNLSHFLFKTDRYLDSLTLLEQISKNAEIPEVFMHMGQCNIKLGRYQDGQIALKHALSLEPDNPEFKFYYAWIHQLNHRPDISIKILSDISIKNIKDTSLRNKITELFDDIRSRSVQN